MDWKTLLFFLNSRYETIDILGPSSQTATNTTSLPVTITTEKPEGNDWFLSHCVPLYLILFEEDASDFLIFWSAHTS